MHYFTPERYIQLQRINDESSFTTAYEEWECALAAYRETLAKIEPGLPVELRQFASRECLHDAILLGSWREELCLSMLLRPELSQEPLFLLLYQLVEPPQIDAVAFPPEYGTPHVNWLYDELALADQTPSSDPDACSVFTHSILFSNGCEMRLRFKQFHYSRPKNVLGPELGSLNALLSSPTSHST